MKSHQPKTITLLILLFMMLALPALATEPTEPPENQAPAAEDLELTTFRGVDVAGTLTAVDPEGDLFEFQLVRSPRKGEIALDPATGRFTYAPSENARGRDTFTYVAIDAQGNISPEATVRIRIERQSRQVSYADMEGHPAHLAAISLVEQGVFVGEQIGGKYFFNPTAPVRRGEFLAMSMQLADTELLTGVVRTGFADDDEIEDWLKPYVSTAVLDGVVQGLRAPNHDLIFEAERYITIYEAAVMLSHILGLDYAPVSGNLQAALIAPDWARQAKANLITENIIPLSYPGVHQNPLTRADVADMLFSAMHLLEGRDGPAASLLGWAA
ncbi:MAG: Ig-like domain-containing protein [Oscillospiraceae bacterium]|nr:Ig-like domain-containing protein [Oscillospiraceae bacterium]